MQGVKDFVFTDAEWADAHGHWADAPEASDTPWDSEDGEAPGSEA